MQLNEIQDSLTQFGQISLTSPNEPFQPQEMMSTSLIGDIANLGEPPASSSETMGTEQLSFLLDLAINNMEQFVDDL